MTQSPKWKCGNEYAPYHPQASHVRPDYRDGWNACYHAHDAAAATSDVIAALRELHEAATLLASKTLSVLVAAQSSAALPAPPADAEKKT